MTSQYLEADIVRDEGTRFNAYPDPLTGGAPWTIGNGHTGREVHPGLVWTQAQVDAARKADIAAVAQGLDTAIPWWKNLSDLRQDCLVNQAFNLGVHGLLGFNYYLTLVKEGKYEEASTDVMHTLWAKQVGPRAQRVATQMATNIHQP